MSKIVMIGGGFAALAAAEEIVKNNDGSFELTLISRSRNLFLYPALVPYVFGSFDREDLTVDIAPTLAERNIRFLIGEVTRIDAATNTVAYAGHEGEEQVRYDLLLIATGRQLVVGSVPGSSEYADHLLDTDAADKLRARIHDFRTGSIVVGLSPGSNLPIPVCEAALAFAERFASEIGNGSVSVTAVFPQTLDDAFQGANLFRDLPNEFKRKGITLRENYRVERVLQKKILDADDNAIPSDLTMLIPPFKGRMNIAGLDRHVDADGFIEVDENLRVKDLNRIYAAGDIIALAGPRFGYMALRQGKIAGRNLLRAALGEEPAEVYEHSIAWAIGERYTGSIFFHYGFWDESLDDFDEEVLFGLVKPIRGKYGHIKGFGTSLAVP
ncbi:MAG: NAD(P)/FAD-dependent oxidoreductase [Pyrinomonadaceae bacterium]